MVTIPKEFKEKAGWMVRDKLDVEYAAGKILLKKPKIKKKKRTILDWPKDAISIPNFKEIPWKEIKEGFYDR